MLVNRPPYTIKRACAYLKLSDDTVRRLIAKRVLRTCRITRKILIPACDVENLAAVSGIPECMPEKITQVVQPTGTQ